MAGTEVTVRSDIYALGLVLYEMFTGKRAFEANSLAEMTRLREEVGPPSCFRWCAIWTPLWSALSGGVLRRIAKSPCLRAGRGGGAAGRRSAGGRIGGG